MLKKLLAAATAVVLGLGIVTLVAAPASAHTPQVSGTFACDSPTSGTITWTIGNDTGHNYGAATIKTLTLNPNASLNNDLSTSSLPQQSSTATVTQTVTSSTSYTLTAILHWSDGDYSNTSSPVRPDFSKCATVTPKTPGLGTGDCTSPGKGTVTFYDVDKVKFQYRSATSDAWKDVDYDGTNKTVTLSVPTGNLYVQVDGARSPYQLPNNYRPSWSNPLTVLGKTAQQCQPNANPPVKPTPNDAVCTGVGSSAGSLVFTSTVGIQYSYTTRTGNGPWSAPIPVTFPVGQTQVTVSLTQGTTARVSWSVISGYNAPQGWSSSGSFSPDVTIGGVVGKYCIQPPAITDVLGAGCVGTTPTKPQFKVPDGDGFHDAGKVGYYLNPNRPNDLLDSGWNTYSGGGTSLTVYARPLGNYVFVGSPTPTQLTVQFPTAKDCRATLVPGFTFTQFDCTSGHDSTGGTYSVTAVKDGRGNPLVKYTYVQGGTGTLTPGTTYTATDGQIVQVTATILDPTKYRWADGVNPSPAAFPFTKVDCRVSVTPVTPNDPKAFVCTDVPGGISGGTFSLPATPSTPQVTYEYKIGDGPWTPMTQGQTYPGVQGQTVSIRWSLADPLHYKWAEGVSTEPYGYKFATVDCVVPVKVVPPTAQDQDCVVDGAGHGSYVSGWIFIPGTTGVIYTITKDGAAVTPTLVRIVDGGAEYVLPPATYSVSAAADTGYRLTGYEKPWPLTIDFADACGDLVTHPLVTPAVSQVQLGCSTPGSYTLSNDLDIPDAVVWTVNGSTVAANTYPVTKAGTVTIHVAPASTDFGFADGQQTDWKLTFAVASTCSLATLALTGTALPIGLIGSAVLLLLTGLTLLGVQLVRRRRADEV